MPYAPEGNPKDCSIVFVGEAPAKQEIERGRPFVGKAGYVFDECLEVSSISRATCYITNVFDFMVEKDQKTKNILHGVNGPGDPVWDRGTVLWRSRGGLTPDAAPFVERLRRELEGTSANVICPLGNPALEALCGVKGITKYRGSILPSTLIPGKKCIPVIHPASALHGMYTNRYLIRRDFQRARKEREFPEIRRPPYKFINNPTFIDCLNYLLWLLKQQPQVSIDIEVNQSQCSRISYATSDYNSISIPYGDGGWTLQQEAELWEATALVLEYPGIKKIFQNACFDVQFLLMVHGILIPMEPSNLDDTMTMHHILYPDYPKGLAFLTSLYTDQPYYKGMVKHGEIDKADG